MAKIYNNDKGHLVIKLTNKDVNTLGFGIAIMAINNLVICDTCNNEVNSDEIYYVCAINRILCKDCLDDYLDNMKHYEDDDSINYEINHFNAVASKIGMRERAYKTVDNKIIFSYV